MGGQNAAVNLRNEAVNLENEAVDFQNEAATNGLLGHIVSP